MSIYGKMTDEEFEESVLEDEILLGDLVSYGLNEARALDVLRSGRAYDVLAGIYEFPGRRLGA